MKKYIILLIVSVFLFHIRPTRAQSHYFLSAEETDGAQILSQKTFDGSSLWGYINGGADLYFEYGFQKLYLQEISKDTRQYKIEIYVMNDAESAFGIFSVSRFKCKSDSSLPVLNCAMPYQLQFIQGSYFVSISHSGTSVEEQYSTRYLEYMRFLARRLIPKMPADSFLIPSEFRDTSYIPSLERLILIKGPLGLMNTYPEWLPLFERCPFAKIYLLPVYSDTFLLTIANIQFDNESVLSVFLGATGIRPLQRGEWTVTDTHQSSLTGILLVSGKELFFVQSNRPINELEPFLKPMKKENQIRKKR